MAKLDIIVTHYDEPWDVCEKFFLMLSLQRMVDFHDIHVLVMHDGTEKFPDEYFTRYPYVVEQYELKHGGVSHARNEGIRKATAEWIQFCDCDDMYASVYSLRHVLTLLPAEGYDILWSRFYSEDQTAEGEKVLHVRKRNGVFIHSKYFRRQFLIDSKLWFPEDLEFNEDSCFCTSAFAMCDYKRIGEITVDTPLYVWMYREGSATATQTNRVKACIGLYGRNKKVLEVFRKNVPRERYLTMVCRVCFDAYHMLCLKHLPNDLKPLEDDFRTFWKEHKQEYMECDRGMRIEAMRVSRRERDQGDKEERERWGTESDLQFDSSRKFAEWIRRIEGK